MAKRSSPKTYKISGNVFARDLVSPSVTSHVASMASALRGLITTLQSSALDQRTRKRLIRHGAEAIVSLETLHTTLHNILQGTSRKK